MHETNSLAWWNDYFVTQWEANNGREQTRYFMSRLLDHLAAREAQWMSAGSRTILDWGCALGDGADLLQLRFPLSAVTGLDFSRSAIDKARKLYPAQPFILSEGGEIAEDYDVIVTSNCLEHYREPFDIVASHLKRCRYLYLLMVPFEETTLHETHVTPFDIHSFPDEIDGARKLGSAVFTAIPRHWDGKQIVVAYASRAYCDLMPGIIDGPRLGDCTS